MRSIWKGAISFGLVTIPVKLYSATEERDVSFHQVRRSDGSRIKYKRVAVADGEEVTFGDIAKGYELSSGETVIITDEDLADLPLSSSRAIDVLQFVPLEQVDPIYFAKSYYLEPDKSGSKPYVLLRDALEQSGQVALVKVALRQRESLATLRVRDGVFVLETMIWPDEVRAPDFAFLDEDIEVRPQELAMAGSLIESLAGDFEPEQYKDGYREALEAVITAKVEGREVIAPAAEADTGGAVLDLMAALRASVDAAKKSREGAAGQAAPEPATTPKRASRRKPAAEPKAAADPAESSSAASASTARSRAAPAAAAATSGAVQSVGKRAVGGTSAAKPSARKPAAASTASSAPAARSASAARKPAADGSAGAKPSARKPAAKRGAAVEADEPTPLRAVRTRRSA